jgi:transcription factor MYB, plant
LCLVAVSKLQGNFLKKDDPRLSALTQQAELLSSLAQRRIAETSNQETENAWKVKSSTSITCGYTQSFF